MAHGKWQKRFLVGEKFFIDVGALGPLPEVFFTLIGGVGFFEGEPFALDDELLGAKIAAPQPGDGGAKFVEASPLYFRVLLGGKRLSGGGKVESNPMGELCGERVGEEFVPGGFFIVEAADELTGLLANLPVAKSA